MSRRLGTGRLAAHAARPFAWVAAAAFFALAATASAQVTVIGNVRPADDPFSDFNEGIQPQVVFDELFPTDEQFDYERGDNLEIGISSLGVVRVLGGDDLRYEHLILGGDEEDVTTGDDVVIVPDELEGYTTGVGILRIEQFGSSFNNHPRIIPAEYRDPDGANPEEPRFPVPTDFDVDIDFNGDGTPDRTVTVDSERDRDDGFDALVGLTGTGEIYLNTGAFMEIEDAFIMGYAPQSRGYVEVDGVGTYLGVYGGLRPNDEPDPSRETYALATDSIHQMIVGAYGTAEMRITGSAHVDAFFGAAIGVTQSDGADTVTQAFDDEFDDRGTGSVIVDGPGSTWNIIYGALGPFVADTLPFDAALAVGEFDSDANPDYSDDELGEGLLSIRNQGFVRVDGSDPDNLDSRDVRVGRKGTVDFRSGRMFVRDDMVNDGVIQAITPSESVAGGVTPGVSRLQVGTFQNRPFGEVRVGAGQRLVIDSHEPVGEFSTFDGEPFITGNFGLVEVLGNAANGVAEIEFDREFEGNVAEDVMLVSGAEHSGANLEVFFNSYDTTGGAGDEPSTRGQVVARDAVLRFRTGIFNSGDLQFIGGDSVVSGPVYNDGGINGPHSGLPFPVVGLISLSNASHVSFEDPVANDGIITVSDDSSIDFLREGPGAMGSTDTVAYHGVGELNLVSTGDVRVSGNFALGDVFDLGSSAGTGGVLRLAVEDFTRDAFSQLVIEGDADFDFGAPATIEILELAPPSGLGPSLAPGDEFEFITVLGANSGIAPGNVVVSSLPASPTAGLAFMPSATASGFGLVVVEDNSFGADFNGDGVVDASDVTVWQQHHGLAKGAAGVHGDVDLDGDVDSTDYFHVLAQIDGGGVPYAVTVPEPAAALLSLVALTALGRRRKR